MDVVCGDGAILAEFCFRAGDTFDWVKFTVEVEGEPMGAGWTPSGTIRRTAADPTVLHTLTFLGSPPEIIPFIPAVATAGFTWRAAVYDIVITHTDGTVYTVARGPVRVEPAVTR